MTVAPSRIHARTEDAGTTTLGYNSRKHKTDPLVAAIADADGTSAAADVAVALGGLDSVIRSLEKVQHDLFDVGADCAQPSPPLTGRRHPRLSSLPPSRPGLMPLSDMPPARAHMPLPGAHVCSLTVRALS